MPCSTPCPSASPCTRTPQTASPQTVSSTFTPPPPPVRLCQAPGPHRQRLRRRLVPSSFRHLSWSGSVSKQKQAWSYLRLPEHFVLSSYRSTPSPNAMINVELVDVFHQVRDGARAAPRKLVAAADRRRLSRVVHWEATPNGQDDSLGCIRVLFLSFPNGIPRPQRRMYVIRTSSTGRDRSRVAPPPESGSCGWPVRCEPGHAHRVFILTRPVWVHQG